MNEDQIALVEAWLVSKGVTLWGDWDLSRPDRRRLAAIWFLLEMTSFTKFLESNG